jgi:hypothetical protein
MQKTLRDLERQQGSAFQVPGYSKNTLKKVWFDG